MDFLLNIDLPFHPSPIRYGDKILLTGSCFTEHIGDALAELKFDTLQNPHGILFDPVSVCKSLISYIDNKKYSEGDLFQINEVWHSWKHHSRFSNLQAARAIEEINHSQQRAHNFLKDADWLIITLGSSFHYKLTEKADGKAGDPVANCHRAPAQWFEKTLLATNEITTLLGECYQQLHAFNPKLKIIFTVSPVRHIRDGVVENNRSKGRLIDAVHSFIANSRDSWYFPAYELVIDVLRDYRFYDIDLVHPNYAATEFVLEKFSGSCIHPDAQQLMKELRKITIARKHKAFQPETKAHGKFLTEHFQKAKALKEKYPFLDLEDELTYFSQV
jgi:hypothetical protein